MPEPEPALILHGKVERIVIHAGASSGQSITGDRNTAMQVVIAPAPAPSAAAEEAPRWRFTLEEKPEGTLKTKVHARLRIEPPQEGGRRMDFPVEVPIPTDAELGDLPWYCRAGARAKAADQTRAAKLEQTMHRCGAAMLEAVLADREAAARWSQAVDGTVLWEMEGSPAFHRIAWERMLDDTRRLHPALHMHLRRRMTDVPSLQARAPEGGPLRMLWVTARPGCKPSRDAVLAPVRAALGGTAEITLVENGSYVEMLRYLREHARRPCFHLLHMDMHGMVCSRDHILSRHAQHPDRWLVENRSGGRRDLPPWDGTQGVLLFEDGGKADPVTARELAAALSLHRMPLVVLNACESALATEDTEDGLALTAELVKAGGFAALGFAQALTVEGAGLFFPAFYRSLAASPDAGRLDEAVRTGRLALHDRATRHGVPLIDWHLPVWYAAREVDLPGGPQP